MRTLARVIPLGLVAVMLSAPGATPVAVAAEVKVEMSSGSYSPAVAYPGLDGTVTWKNITAVEHTATSDQGFFHIFVAGGGVEVSFDFEHAGSFGYSCDGHPTTRGTVKVPLRAPAADANAFTLRWSAVGSNRDGRTFDVQKNSPGASTGWTALRTNTTARYASLNPTRNGYWRYRARVDNTGNPENIQTSGWSPVKLVKVS